MNHLQIVAVGDASKTRSILAKYGAVQETEVKYPPTAKHPPVQTSLRVLPFAPEVCALLPTVEGLVSPPGWRWVMPQGSLLPS